MARGLAFGRVDEAEWSDLELLVEDLPEEEAKEGAVHGVAVVPVAMAPMAALPPAAAAPLALASSGFCSCSTTPSRKRFKISITRKFDMPRGRMGSFKHLRGSRPGAEAISAKELSKRTTCMQEFCACSGSTF